MQNYIRHMLTHLGVVTAHPAAFGVVLAFGVLWGVLHPQDFGWHGFATLATLLMTLVIQRAEHRDTQAIHAKLDELLHAQDHARNELTQLDAEEPEVIELHRRRARRDD